MHGLVVMGRTFVTFFVGQFARFFLGPSEVGEADSCFRQFPRGASLAAGGSYRFAAAEAKPFYQAARVAFCYSPSVTPPFGDGSTSN